MSSRSDSSPPPTMRAWTYTTRGLPSSVLTLSTVPTPRLPSPTSPQPSKTPPPSPQVLIRISHTAFHIGGSIMMQLCPFIFRFAPAIPETDFAGTVISSSSLSLPPGTPVFGSIPVGPHLKRGSGALAEYVLVDASSVCPKPGSMSYEEAAGLAVSGCTALAVMDAAGLKRGDSVLVNGASGNVGHLVVQMARNMVGESGRITGVCSGRNEGLVRGCGADEIIDYTLHSHTPTGISTYLANHHSSTPFTHILDCTGSQSLYTHSPAYLSPLGRFVSVGIAPTSLSYLSMLYSLSLMVKNAFTSMLPSFMGGGRVAFTGIQGFVSREGMERLRGMVEEGRLRVVVDSVWSMEDALKAYEKLLGKRAAGKVVVKVEADESTN